MRRLQKRGKLCPTIIVIDDNMSQVEQSGHCPPEVTAPGHVLSATKTLERKSADRKSRSSKESKEWGLSELVEMSGVPTMSRTDYSHQVSLHTFLKLISK